MSLNNLPELCLLSASSTVVLHFSLLWSLMMSEICWFNRFRSGDLGSVSLSASLSFIFSVASEGISGMMSLIRPVGIVFLAVFEIIKRKVFSPL